MKKINWLDHLVNLFVVIAGITIAFGLNKCSESDKLNELRITYIHSLINDLDADISELDTLIRDDEAAQGAFNFLSNMKQPAPASADSMYWSFRQLVTIGTFPEHGITFESMKNSGKFELIEDVELRMDMIRHYMAGYSAIHEVEKYYQLNFNEYLLPYLINNPVGDDYNEDFKILSSSKFNSIFGLQRALLKQKVEAYKNNRNSAVELKNRLEATLK